MDVSRGMNGSPKPDYAAIGETLVDWFLVARRDLPWRRTTDPYRIWVSEIMLQQTQVVTVIPYYERFVLRFPTVEALARAELDEVLSLWQGLGYYARARSLHRAARILCEQNGCRVPATRTELLALPGIGDYTAGAILSIAFDHDEIAIDGNIERVLCRVFNDDQDPKSGAGRKALRAYAGAVLVKGRAGLSNTALMELGATICTPRRPRCPECPIAAWCQARALGIQELRPVRSPRGELPHREFVAAFCQREGRLLVVRRAPRGLLGGLWELPGGEFEPDQDRAEALLRHLRVGLGVMGRVGEPLAIVHHGYTHFSSTVHVYAFQIEGEPTPGGAWDGVHWLAADEREAYGLTGVTTQVLRRVPWAGNDLLL